MGRIGIHGHVFPAHHRPGYLQPPRAVDQADAAVGREDVRRDVDQGMDFFRVGRSQGQGEGAAGGSTHHDHFLPQFFRHSQGVLGAFPQAVRRHLQQRFGRVQTVGTQTGRVQVDPVPGGKVGGNRLPFQPGGAVSVQVQQNVFGAFQRVSLPEDPAFVVLFDVACCFFSAGKAVLNRLQRPGYGGKFCGKYGGLGPRAGEIDDDQGEKHYAHGREDAAGVCFHGRFFGFGVGVIACIRFQIPCRGPVLRQRRPWRRSVRFPGVRCVPLSNGRRCVGLGRRAGNASTGRGSFSRRSFF